MLSDVPPAYYVQATAYCDRGTMADGTYTRPGSVAHNGYRLGTKLTINGQRYVVRDHIGHGSVLDIWMPSCSQAIAWGRRTVKVRVGWWEKRGRLLVRRHGVSRGGRVGIPLTSKDV